MIVSVSSDIEKAVARLKSVAEAKQFRYSIMRALTETAKQVQSEVRKNMGSRFKLRRRWIVDGIRIRPATMQNLMAEVYSKDFAFMDRQESGGVKTPKRDTHLAIPLAARRNKYDLIKPADLPANLGKASFTLRRGEKEIKRKGYTGSVFKIVKNGKTYLCRRRKDKVEVLYVLVPRARISERLGLNKDGIRVARANFATNLQRALQDAVRTAR